MRKAYLLARIQFDGSPQPKVMSVGIYSDSSTSITTAANREVYTEIISREAETFQEARDKIVNLVYTVPSWRWMRVWISESQEAHIARGYINGCLTFPRN